MATRNGRHPLDDYIVRVRDKANRFGWDGRDTEGHQVLTDWERDLLGLDWLRASIGSAVADACYYRHDGANPARDPKFWLKAGALVIALVAAVAAGIAYGVGRLVGV